MFVRSSGKHTSGGWRRLALPTIALSGSALFAPPADAAARSAAPAKTNKALAAVFAHEYGGRFVSADGVHYTNGVETISRVDGNADQVFNAPLLNAQTVARFGSGKISFGMYDGTSGGSLDKLFDVKGHGYKVSGSTGSMNADGPYRLGTAAGKSAFSSVDAQNADVRDHLVTYAVTGIPGSDATANTYLTFWDDHTRRAGNFGVGDLVVELQTAAASPLAGGNAQPTVTGTSVGNVVSAPATPVLIPLPAAVWTGLAGLLGLGAFGTARKVRAR